MSCRTIGLVLMLGVCLTGVSQAKVIYVDNQATSTPISYQGLMGFWEMNDNAVTKNVIDSSPNALNGTAVRNTADMHVASDNGGALYFNGTSDQIDCGTNAKLLPDAWTVVAWVKCENTASPTLLSFGNYRLVVKLQNNGTGKPAIIMAGNNYRTFDTLAWTTLKDANWHHVVFTMPGKAQNSIQSAQMYLDGAPVAASATVATGSQLSKTRLFLGNTDAAGTQRFKGAMDQVMLFGRVLPAEEIQALYHNQSANTGLSWESAIKTIGEAIAVAAADDEIWVKNGTYTLTQPLTVNKTLKFYGGFAGTEEELTERNIQLNPTTIDGNSAVYHCFQVTTDATIDGFTITRGMATGPLADDQIGGGILAKNSLATVANCIIQNNTAAYGGGAYLNNSPTQFESCTISGNHASANGGGVCNFGGDNSTIHSTFRTCRLAANTAGGKGGALFSTGGTLDHFNHPELANCIVVLNDAEDGGALYFDQYASGDILNCTITGNHAQRGGGMFVFESYSYTRLINTILWGDSSDTGHPEIHFAPTGGTESNPRNLALYYNDIMTGWDPNSDKAENLALDPAFADAGGPDNNPATWADNDYRLLSTSPLIDKGIAQFSAMFAPQTDFLGTTRPLGAEYDMGAYESITGDANNDSATNMLDLLILSENWLMPCDADNDFCDGADFNRSGKVDLTDFIFLSEFWLRNQDR